MSNLISKEKLLESLIRCDGVGRRSLEAVLETIKAQPPVEPVHGEWISKGRKLECSNCGHRVYLGTDDLGLHEEEKMVLKFCSGYGADMRK